MTGAARTHQKNQNLASDQVVPPRNHPNGAYLGWMGEQMSELGAVCRFVQLCVGHNAVQRSNANKCGYRQLKCALVGC